MIFSNSGNTCDKCQYRHRSLHVVTLVSLCGVKNSPLALSVEIIDPCCQNSDSMLMVILYCWQYSDSRGFFIQMLMVIFSIHYWVAGTSLHVQVYRCTCGCGVSTDTGRCNISHDLECADSDCSHCQLFSIALTRCSTTDSDGVHIVYYWLDGIHHI